MSGTTNAEDFRRLLRWHGEKNFYDRFESYWTIITPQGVTEFDSLDFESWKKIWTATPETSEVGAVRGGIGWTTRWWEQPARDLATSDLDLNGASAATGAATDGSNIGVDLIRLPIVSRP